MDVQNQFKADMEAAGYEVRTYAGRSYYFGYAVKVRPDDDFGEDDVIRATKVELRSDSLGKGLIVYPTRGITQSEYEKLEGSD